MGKNGKRKLRKLNKRSRRDELAVGHNRNEAYCPRCRVWYQFGDPKHSGH